MQELLSHRNLETCKNNIITNIYSLLLGNSQGANELTQ
jgi:hypothetical protein